MNQTVITIMKKELARFFGDKRTFITTVILPGLMIFLMYTFMGDAMQSQFTVDEDYKSKISAVGLPESVKLMAEQGELEIKKIAADKVEDAKKQITDQEADLLLIFSEDFDENVAEYDLSSEEEAPRVQVYYNAASTESTTAYSMMTQMLDSYEGSLSNKFDVNPGEEEYNLATEKDTTGSMFASMLPMLLLIFLYSGCTSVAPESIAGEKERGTIATLLITPIRRGDIAMGKIMALSIMALLSGASSTIGTIVSLPKLMGSEEGMETNVYQATDYLLLALVILSTVMVLIALISIISAFAKSIKEAQTYVMPLMVIVMLVGITAMFGNGAEEESVYYLIPLYNSVQSMVGIFSFKAVPVQIVFTVVSNLVVTGAGIFVLTRMFHSEKIMFTK